jgi:colanic acid biosynthesis protein WcaH
MHLSANEFKRVVHSAPLVAIDLIIRDRQGRMLLGHRANPPARGYWFVPGGRIRRGATLDCAFGRLGADELGIALERDAARLAGLYEHFYEEDFTGAMGSGTHYVVLAHVLQLEPDALRP